MRDYVFDEPLDRVWDVATKIFAANIRQAKLLGDHQMASPWTQSGRVEERFVLVGRALDPEHCQVFFLSHRRHVGSATKDDSISGVLEERLQLRLIQEFNPSDAERLSVDK